jgi:hypothetical protein
MEGKEIPPYPWKLSLKMHGECGVILHIKKDSVEAPKKLYQLHKSPHNKEKKSLANSNSENSVL